MKISQFPLIESADGSEQLAIVKDGANGKMKTSAIIAKAKEGLVPQVTGKGLSTNDYTNADKTKLDALPTKTELDASIASKQPAITVSDDIAPLGADKLALTDKAKMAELDAQAAAIGAIHNYTTSYFEYNTLTDITAEQMRKIILFGKTTFTHPGECGYSITPTITDTLNSYIRTNWIQWSADAVSNCTDLRYSFYSQEVEVIIGPKRNDRWNVTPSSMINFCWNCKQLRIIDMYIYMTNLPANQYLFYDCPKLETVYLCAIKTSFNIIGAPLLSLASIQYMVDNAANTTPITITLHPDAHARLTEELIAQAAEKQITFATT